MRRDISERFAEKYQIDPESGCWLWTAGIDRYGYGKFKAEGKDRGAHCVSWELHRGAIPEGLHIDHLCRVKRCVNPDHLEPVTQGVNNQRYKVLIEQCPYGHSYDEANTYIDPKGVRHCRECNRVYSARKRVKRRA